MPHRSVDVLASSSRAVRLSTDSSCAVVWTQFPHRFDLHGESGCADKLFIPNQQDELLPSGCLPDTLDLVIDPVQMARGLLLH